jgi:hypothetical protein
MMLIIPIQADRRHGLVDECSGFSVTLMKKNNGQMDALESVFEGTVGSII